MNAARAGAQAVLIVPPEDTAVADLAAPAVVKHSATAQQEALYLQHVNIPVGIMTYDDGANIYACKNCGDDSALKRTPLQVKVAHSGICMHRIF